MKQGWLAKCRTWYACVIMNKDALWVLCNWRMHNYARALRRVHARPSAQQRAFSSAYRYDNWHLHLCNTATKVKIISVWHHLISINGTTVVLSGFCTGGARFDKHFLLVCWPHWFTLLVCWPIWFTLPQAFSTRQELCASTSKRNHINLIAAPFVCFLLFMRVYVYMYITFCKKTFL